jgi:hypothetical protein
MVALIVSLVILFGLLSLLIPMAKRRPPGTPMTWGEAMVASTFSFFLFFWAYGVVPHLWLTFADNELKWRPDAFVYTSWGWTGGVFKPQSAGGWMPLTISMQTLRDLVAVSIYGLFLVLNVAVWAWWNNRGERAEKKAKAIPSSQYGRPLARKA